MKTKKQALVIFADNVRRTDITAFSLYFLIIVILLDCKCYERKLLFFCCKRTTAVSLLAVNLYYVYLYMFEYKSEYCIITMDIYEVYRARRLVVYIA